MCGIAGVIETYPGVGVDESTVHRMCEAMVHRGPDDEGIHVRSGVGFGMRRLSIIDLVGGRQPVFNEDKTVWVVFNGEIYNFPELRAQLEERGHRFYTNSDTEVIVHLYEDLGADCVDKLRGMFAFALYDERRRKVLMARDRLGKKPLHYAMTNGRLLFASEIKSIVAIAPELAEVNKEALLQYLYFGYVPDPLSIFQLIQKLPAGHLLEFESGRIHVRQYWNLPAYGTHEPASEEECLQELEWRLAEAVRIRLISDVPLGAWLSGGIDSSTVVALMARASSKPVKTFSIGFSHDDFNEAHYARIVAEYFNTEHHELVLAPNVLETVEKLTSSLEEPFGDSSMLPTYFVSCMARKHVTVALSGDGGDELFAGYDRYAINLRWREFERIPLWARDLYRQQVFPRLPQNLRGRRLSYNVCLPWQERYVDSISFIPSIERDMPLLSGDFREVLRACGNPENVMYKYFQEAPAADPVSQMLYVDTKTYLVGDILTKVDRMSMATSLEVRVPILDHLFVEWVTGLPASWKLRGRQQKYILRKLAERVGVPRQAMDRPKQGFAVPLVHWMRNELKGLIQSVLLEPRALQRGYFNPKSVRCLLEEHFEERRNHSHEIWRLLMLELWHRNVLENIPAKHSADKPHRAPAAENLA
jgi:asparagine synthase (glutamine-hydrolysing)